MTKELEEAGRFTIQVYGCGLSGETSRCDWSEVRKKIELYEKAIESERAEAVEEFRKKKIEEIQEYMKKSKPKNELADIINAGLEEAIGILEDN